MICCDCQHPMPGTLGDPICDDCVRTAADQGYTASARVAQLTEQTPPHTEPYTVADVCNTACVVSVPDVPTLGGAYLLRDGTWRNGSGFVRGNTSAREDVDRWIMQHGAAFRTRNQSVLDLDASDTACAAGS